MDWNDLRFFVAVADHGSTLKAGRTLRVSQTTVARRIAALEASVGLSLFERRFAGYTLTPDGESLLAHARQVAGAATQFETAAASRERDLSGSVRLTTQEIFAITLLAPMIKELHDMHPEILLEVDTQQDLLDLGEGQADIALRSTGKDAPAGIVGRCLCDDDWTLYCSTDYAAAHGVPRTRAELKQHAIIGGGGGKLWLHYEAWLRSLGLEGQVAMHHATSMGLLSGVRSGFGLAVLPCVIADAEADLVRCLPPRADHGRSMWLLTHERIRHTPRVRLVIDFLYERLATHVRMLEAQRAVA
ncbi:MAG TPA: LysR family transcriptional regulator [Sphingomicrobium sp.]|nr:LysR family transcriptional regulator [Sphingomicrobium sp.]